MGDIAEIFLVGPIGGTACACVPSQASALMASLSDSGTAKLVCGEEGAEEPRMEQS